MFKTFKNVREALKPHFIFITVVRGQEKSVNKKIKATQIHKKIMASRYWHVIRMKLNNIGKMNDV